MFQRCIIIELYYFSLKQANNGRCIIAVRGSLIYTFMNHPLPGLVHIFCLQRFSSIFESKVLNKEIPTEIMICFGTKFKLLVDLSVIESDIDFGICLTSLS